MKKLIALSLVLGVLVAAGCAEERVNRKTPAKAECADIAGYWLRVGMGDKADLMSITDSCANAEIRENHNSGSIFEGRIGEISKAGNNFKLQHSEENARDMAADYMIVQPAADETAKLAAVEKETLRIKNEMKFHLEATVTDGKRQLLKVLEGKEGNPETNGVLRFNLIILLLLLFFFFRIFDNFCFELSCSDVCLFCFPQISRVFSLKYNR
jgi:hypothetical protein